MTEPQSSSSRLGVIVLIVVFGLISGVVAFRAMSHRTLTFQSQVTPETKPAESQPSQVKPKREPIYDEKADAQADIARALERARQGNKRVLLMYGGNWCGWCYRFNDLLHKDPQISPAMAKFYELVHVDSRANPKLEEKYGTDREKGYPYLTVLDATGKVVCNQETGVLEDGPGYKPAAVLEFLLKHRSEAATPASGPA